MFIDSSLPLLGSLRRQLPGLHMRFQRLCQCLRLKAYTMTRTALRIVPKVISFDTLVRLKFRFGRRGWRA